jgi:hypothetical protein
VGERGKAMSGHPGKIAEHCRVAAGTATARELDWEAVALTRRMAILIERQVEEVETHVQTS